MIIWECGYVVDTSYTFLYVINDNLLIAQICIRPSEFEGIKSHTDYKKLFIKNGRNSVFFEWFKIFF